MKKLLTLMLSITLVFSLFPMQALAYNNVEDTVHWIGQGHQDTNWLWDEPDTVQQVINTTIRVIELVELQPDFIFTYPAGYNVELLRRYRPDLFEQVLDLIQSGNWEQVGGQYVEPDENIPGGENAVRQYLYGRQYTNDVLKAPESRVAYMPDTFGHIASFPQLAKKVGLDYYYETKNDQISGKQFRYPMYMNWIGADGTSIPTVNAWDYNYTGTINAAYLNTAMNFPINGKNNENIATVLSDGRVVHDVARTFGAGDRGGGPTVTQVNAITTLIANNAADYPKPKFNSLKGFFDVVKDSVFPYVTYNWDDELYMEVARQGCYSNDAAGKYLMRRNQDLAEVTEKFATAANWLGCADYQYDKITEAYMLLEKDSFHDNCYGTHMTPEPMARHISEHGFIANWFNDSLAYSFNSIASNLNTSTAADGIPVVVFNALSYVRKDVAEVTVEFDSVPAYVKVFDTVTNDEVLSQIIGRNDNAIDVIFEANDVPSVGYKLYKVVASATPSTLTSSLTATTSGADKIIANNVLSATIADNGTISNLTLKDGNINVVSGDAGMNELQFFYDSGQARDITRTQMKTTTPQRLNSADAATTPFAPAIIEEGPLRTVVRVQKAPGNVGGTNATHGSTGRSDFTIDYILYSNSDRVDIVQKTNWDEIQRFLKTAFYTNFTADKVTFDIPYGTVDRLASHMIGSSAIKFEVAGQKWADMSGTISGATYGVSILNNSKLGWDMFTDNCLRMSMLRSPTQNGSTSYNSSSPFYDAQREVGYYEDTYAIYPHKDTWDKANTVEEAQSLNIPLRTYVTDVHTGNLSGSFSFAGVSASNVQLSVVKQSEGVEGSRSNPDGWTTIRLYETNGIASTPVNITFAGNILEAKETDLIELDRGDWRTGCTISGNTLTTTIKKYELKTFKVKLAPNTPASAPLSKILVLPFNEIGITTKDNAALGNIDGKGYTLPANYAPTEISNAGVPFKFGAADVVNIMRPTGQTITVGGTGYKSFNFIAASTKSENSRVALDVTLNYGDGTSDKASVMVRDAISIGLKWNLPAIQDTIAWYFNYGHKPDVQQYDGYDRSKERLLYEYRLPVNSNKELTSVSFQSENDSVFGKPHVAIFAATASSQEIYAAVKTADVLPPTDEEYYWNFSDLTPGSAIGENIEKQNLAGAVEPLGYRAFTALHSAGVPGTNSESAPNILNNDGSTKYCQSVNASNAWFILDAGESIKMPGYVIRGANDDMSYASRRLHTWIVQGSDSPSGPWTTISEPGAQGAGWTVNYQTRMYLFDSAAIPNTGFRYYRLQVTHTGNTAAGTALGTSNTTIQFSYFGFATSYGENGSLDTQVVNGVTKQANTITVASAYGPNIISVNGAIASTVSAPVTAKNFTSIRKRLNIGIYPDTKLAYMIKPMNSVSAHMSIDLKFDDGTSLKDLKAVDQYGIGVNAKAQGEGAKLTAGQWNYVEAELGKVANGKVVTEIILGFDIEGATPGDQIESFFDNIMFFRNSWDYEDVNAIVGVYTSEGRLVDNGVCKQPIVLDSSAAGEDYYFKSFLWTAEWFVPIAEAVRY